jgi:hypothetical protein
LQIGVFLFEINFSHNENFREYLLLLFEEEEKEYGEIYISLVGDNHLVK